MYAVYGLVLELPSGSTVSVTSDSAGAIESVISIRFDGVCILEDTASFKSDKNSLVELIVSVLLDRSGQLEFQAATRLDGGTGLEVTSASRSDMVVQAEQVSSVHYDVSDAIEGLLSSKSERGSGVESAVNVTSDDQNVLNWGMLARTDGQAQNEIIGAIVVTTDGRIYLDVSSSVNSNTSQNSESTASFSSSYAITSENIIGLILDQSLILNNGKLVIGDVETQAEILGATGITSDGRLYLDLLEAVNTSTLSSLETTGSTSTTSNASSENTSAKSTDSAVKSELGLQVFSDIAETSENVSVITFTADGKIALESLSSASFTSLSNSETTAKTLLSVVVDSESVSSVISDRLSVTASSLGVAANSKSIAEFLGIVGSVLTDTPFTLEVRGPYIVLRPLKSPHNKRVLIAPPINSRLI